MDQLIRWCCIDRLSWHPITVRSILTEVNRPSHSSSYSGRSVSSACCRRRTAITLSLIFALLVISRAALYSAHGDFDKTKELLDKLLPALTGLIGSALGFYFGSKSSNA